MTKQQPKNWWDEDETVAPAQPAATAKAPAKAAGNWWDDDEDASAAKAPPASMAPAAKAPPASVGTGAASMGIGAGFANPARIVPISPLKPGASEYRPEIEGYKGKQFPTNWPKGMAAPPMPPQGYSWQDTGYSYDLRQDAPKDFVSMSPAQLRQMREEQAAAAEAEAQRSAAQRESDAAFGGMDGLPMFVGDDGTSAPRPQRDLGVRATVNALNTAGPGTINAGLDMAEMAASNVAGGPAMRAYAAMQNQQEQPRITFGAENASKPQPQDMRLRVPELPMQAPEDGWQAGADVVGQLVGYMATPGQATEAALKATGATNALMRFAPQGSSAAAKAGRYGARILNPIDDVAHAAAFGAVTAEDGKTAETALQYATDPINYIGRPIASLLYRGGIALDSLGKRVTPEAIELERAMSLLNGPNPTAAQVQEAAQIIDRLAPADATPSQPTTSVPTFTRPQAEPPPVQPQAAAQAAPQAPPVQAGVTPPAPPQPPVAGPTMAAGASGTPPGVPVAQAAQTPPPGTLTPAGNGVAVDSFNNLPVKTREGVLRALEASGMTRPQAFDAIRSLNDLPPDRANMFEFELIRRFGGPDQFPNLQANLTAMGSDFSMQTGRKGGSPQEVMNKSLLDQAQSEGEYLTRMAENIFGDGKVATKQELDAFRNQLGGQYRKQLEQTYPGLTRLRSPQAKLELQARIDPARKELTEYLLRPEVMEAVPQWVRDQVMLQVSDDLRFIRLDDAGQQFRIQQNPELAPLLTPERTLQYSPKLWKTLVEMYPTQVAHSLQSAYRQAIDEAYSGISNAVDRTTAKRLKRLRGESRVRANAADPNKRGYGLLHLLEQASPGYKDIRQQFGDVVGAQKAADMPNTFFRIAKDEEALANFIDVYDNELTPLQQEAVRNGITTQIRQALKNKTEFTQPWELDAASRGNLPNLTAVSSQMFLEALPRVFGRDGERMADAIRLSRANIDNIQAINKNFASGTPKGTEIQKNARNLYENPSATNLNPIDATTSTLSGVGALSAMTGNAPLSAAVLGGAAARALYRAYKNGKSLTPGQREALAEWLFKPRRATDASPPTTPRRFSNIGYAGNVLTGAGVGAGAAAATGQDPTAGAVAGALGGGVRAGLRAMRAERSIIKPPPAGGPRGGNRLRTGGNPPPPVGPAGAPQIVQNGWFGGGKKPPRTPKAPPGAGPRNAPVQTVTQPVQTTKMQVSELRTKNGSVPVEAEVFPDRGAVVMSPKWPSYDAMQLEDAISRQRGRLPTSLDRWESFAKQNPQEAAMLESDIAAEFNKLAKSGQAPAYNLALFEDYNGKNIVDMVRKAKGDNQVVLRTKDGGDVAVVDRKWLANNTDRYPRVTWETVNDRWPLRQGENYHIIPRGDRFVVIDDASKEVSGGLEFTSRRDALGWLRSETSAFSDGPSPTRLQSARAANDVAPPPASAPKPPPVKNGFGSSKLPMDEASRMQRAREMGFDVDTPLYHGTNSNIEGFDRGKFGGSTGALSAEQGVWLTTSPKTASSYAKLAAEDSPVRKLIEQYYAAQSRGQWDKADELLREAERLEPRLAEGLGDAAVYPTYVRGRLKEIDLDGARYEPDDTRLNDIIEKAKREGYDGVRLKNLSDDPYYGNHDPADHVVIFDPKNIRGKFAKFDPAQSGSSKLLAGMADNATGYGTAGGAIAGVTFARDTNDDGVVDANERAAGALGGAITGGIAGKAVGAGARRMGKAPPMRNALRRGPDQAGFSGSKPPPAKGPSKSKSRIPGEIGRRVAVGATTGVAINLANDAGAQDDLAQKISRTEQDIEAIKKAMADFNKITDPRAKQQFLKDAGFYAGKIDGNIAGKTTEGIERWKAQQAAALKKAEDDYTELVRRDAYQKNQPDAIMQGLREFGPTTALVGALFGMKLMRGGAARKAAMAAEAESRQLNRLITKAPVTGFINKADQSRPANLNALWQKGGANADELPFKQDSSGKWKPNPKAKAADELFKYDSLWQSVSKYIKGKDIALILGGSADAVGMQPFIDKANEDLKQAEAEWKANPSDETFKRVEDAKNAVMIYTTLQRFGMGLAGGRVLGSIGAKYAKPKPNIPAAATEQAALKQYIASLPPPPKARVGSNAARQSKYKMSKQSYAALAERASEAEKLRAQGVSDLEIANRLEINLSARLTPNMKKVYELKLLGATDDQIIEQAGLDPNWKPDPNALADMLRQAGASEADLLPLWDKMTAHAPKIGSNEEWVAIMYETAKERLSKAANPAARATEIIDQMIDNAKRLGPKRKK